MRKSIILNRLLFALAIILAFYSFGFSQFEKYSVPAKWELYSVKDKKVSFLMPRLPVLIDEGKNSCNGQSSQTYSAYTNGVVYSVKIVSALKPQKFCREKKEFDETFFFERIAALGTNLKKETTDQNNSGNSIVKFYGTNKITKLVNDYDHKRWFEFSVDGANENNEIAKNFLASLKNADQSSGIEIGSGAAQTFGDDVPNSIIETKKTVQNEQPENSEKIETGKQMLVKIEDQTAKGVTIIIKPRAGYTDSARQSRIKGKVVLRVTFLANGAIGNIEKVTELPNGLTEESIKAASKMSFIPAQRDGVRYSVVKMVEYGFTIY
jgi:hypothetical protein